MLPVGYRIRTMDIADYEAVMALWLATEGMGLGDSDTRPAIAAFLERNPGLSRVLETQQGEIVGALLCGHDGRRAYLHHLAVARSQRKKGLGRALVEACTADAKTLGIPKCTLLLFSHNEAGHQFWKHEGWSTREDLLVIQKSI